MQKLPETAETKAAVSEIYTALRIPIVDGEIPPGTRINIDAVARELGVSQTPVREALQRLDGDGLLVYSPGKGYRTTPMLDLRGLRSLFEFRLLIEPWAARSVATDRLANPSSGLIEELRMFESLAGSERDVRHDMLVHDARFHNMILTAVGNDVIQQAYAQTHCHLHVLRLYPVDFDGTLTISEHRKIWQAIHDCEPDQAERMMAQHIRNSFERSARVFEGLNSPVAPLSREEFPRAHIVR